MSLDPEHFIVSEPSIQPRSWTLNNFFQRIGAHKCFRSRRPEEGDSNVPKHMRRSKGWVNGKHRLNRLMEDHRRKSVGNRTELDIHTTL